MKILFTCFVLAGLIDESLTLTGLVFKHFNRNNVRFLLYINSMYLLGNIIFLFYVPQYSIGYLVEAIWVFSILDSIARKYNPENSFIYRVARSCFTLSALIILATYFIFTEIYH
jgi:hypothetical protein